MIDWTFALMFRPDVVKVGLDSEAALLIREMAASTEPVSKPTEGNSVPSHLARADVPRGQTSGQHD
jgi:hypothetical protein